MTKIKSYDIILGKSGNGFPIMANRRIEERGVVMLVAKMFIVVAGVFVALNALAVLVSLSDKETREGIGEHMGTVALQTLALAAAIKFIWVG